MGHCFSSARREADAPVSPLSEAYFAKILEFREIRDEADAIWREELTDRDPDSALVSLEEATRRVFADSTFDCDHTGRDPAAAQQQNLLGAPVADMEELYAAATGASEVFAAFLRRVLSGIGGLRFDPSLIAPLKSTSRAREKAREDYAGREPGPPESWLYDVVRARVECASVAELRQVLQAVFEEAEALGTADGRVLRVKNRCVRPPISGCRDLLVNIQLPVPMPRVDRDPAKRAHYLHVCELQIHHVRMRDHDENRGSHDLYEHFRTFFSGGIATAQSRVDAVYAFHSALEDIRRRAGRETAGLGALVAHLCASGRDAAVLRVLEHLLRYELGEYEAALRVSSRLLQVSGARTSRAEGLLRQGLNCDQRGDYDAAMAKYGEALKVYKEALGGDHPLVAQALNNMADVKLNQGDVDGSEALYGEALRIRSAVLGEDHPEVASTLMGIANARQTKGDFDGAERLYDRALAIADAAAKGEASAAASDILYNMGVLMLAQGRLKGAKPFLSRALKQRREVYGEEHPQTRVVKAICEDLDGSEFEGSAERMFK